MLGGLLTDAWKVVMQEDAWQGSSSSYDVVCHRDVMVPMRDGVRLAVDLYLPGLNGKPAPGRFPVVLERTPYGKLEPVRINTGQYFARRGYVCAVQDVRGRFASEGQWHPFVKEPEDGYDTVQWLAEHPSSDGKVGTMGSSYAGSNQSALATLNPPALKTMIIAVGAANYYQASMRHNGALELRWLMYAFTMACDSKEAQVDPVIAAAARADRDRVLQWLRQPLFRAQHTSLMRLPTYAQWADEIVRHTDYDDYWRQRGYAYSEYFDEGADVPTLHLGGWYDSYARATCESFTMLSERKTSPQRLVMGPWCHDGWQDPFAGELHFGPAAVLHYNDVRLMWFDQYLKELNTPVSDWPAVQYFVMGGGTGRRLHSGYIDYGGQWRHAAQFPIIEAEPTPYYLHSEGRLDMQPPTGEAEPGQYTFDPRDPVPTIGGCISSANEIMPPGGFDQRGRPELAHINDDLPLSARADVLCFQTEPLPRDVTIAGPITVVLHASSSATDTDFTAKLIDVLPPDDDHPQGLAINLTDSIIRARYRNGGQQPSLIEPERVYELRFQLYPTATVFRAGHRIRLDISSSNFPRFDVNSNTGAKGVHDGNIHVAHQKIYHDARHPSHILLPILGRDASNP